MDVLSMGFGPNFRRGVRIIRHAQLAMIDVRWISDRCLVVIGQAAGATALVGLEVGLFDQARLQLYGAALIGGAIAGLAYQLRTGGFIFSACLVWMLNSSLVALLIMLIGMAWTSFNPLGLLGVSMLCALLGKPILAMFEKVIQDLLGYFVRWVERWAGAKKQDDSP